MSAVIWPKRERLRRQNRRPTWRGGGVFFAGGAVEVTQGRERQRPPVGAAGQVLLAEGQVVPIPLPPDQGQSDMAEPRAGQRLRYLDIGVWPRREAAEQLEDQAVVVDERGVGLFGRQWAAPLGLLRASAGRSKQGHGHLAVDAGAVVDPVAHGAEQGVFVALQVPGTVSGGAFGYHQLVGAPVGHDDGPQQAGRAVQLGQTARIEDAQAKRAARPRRTSAGWPDRGQ